MNFTPGPWTIGEFEGHVFAGKRLVAGCMGHQDGLEGTRLDNLANARLIAASPSMYSALHLAYSYFAAHSHGDNEATEHFKRIGAILAQVEGRDASRS